MSPGMSVRPPQSMTCAVSEEMRRSETSLKCPFSTSTSYPPRDSSNRGSRRFRLRKRKLSFIELLHFSATGHADHRCSIRELARSDGFQRTSVSAHSKYHDHQRS